MNPHSLLAWVAALFTALSLFTHTVAARLLLLAIGIGLAAWVLARERAHSNPVAPRPPVWIPFALWAGWAALSIAWSLEPDRSAKEWRNEVFYTGASLWICYVGAQARAAPRIFLGVVAVAATSVCAIALYYSTRGFDVYQRGLHGGSGNHSSALLVLLPCAVAIAWAAVRARWPRWIPVCAFALLVLFAFGAYATLNRTIWLGIALQLMLIGALALRLADAPSRRVRVAMSVAALAVVAISAVVILSIHAQREAHGTPAAFNADVRLALWPEVLDLVRERPITGYGFGRGLLRHLLREDLGSEELWHAHNFFLEALLQTGVLGLLLHLLLLAALAREGWHAARTRDERLVACGMVLLAIIVGMLVRNMTDTLFVRQNALLFWSVAGAFLGFIARRRKECSESSAAAASTTSKT
jgi:O-antigen ligase